jgi:hypothetical protein
MGKPIEILDARATQSDKRDCWTQGMTQDLQSDGSFEVVQMPGLTLLEAERIVQAMLTCPTVEDKQKYCPPAFGVEGSGNVCRIENGDYYLWPDSVYGEVYFALAWLRSIF